MDRQKQLLQYLQSQGYYNDYDEAKFASKLNDPNWAGALYNGMRQNGLMSEKFDSFDSFANDLGIKKKTQPGAGSGVGSQEVSLTPPQVEAPAPPSPQAPGPQPATTPPMGVPTQEQVSREQLARQRQIAEQTPLVLSPERYKQAEQERAQPAELGQIEQDFPIKSPQSGVADLQRARSERMTGVQRPAPATPTPAMDEIKGTAYPDMFEKRRQPIVSPSGRIVGYTDQPAKERTLNSGIKLSEAYTLLKIRGEIPRDTKLNDFVNQYARDANKIAELDAKVTGIRQEKEQAKQAAELQVQQEYAAGVSQAKQILETRTGKEYSEEQVRKMLEEQFGIYAPGKEPVESIAPEKLKVPESQKTGRWTSGFAAGAKVILPGVVSTLRQASLFPEFVMDTYTDIFADRDGEITRLIDLQQKGLVDPEVVKEVYDKRKKAAKVVLDANSLLNPTLLGVKATNAIQEEIGTKERAERAKQRYQEAAKALELAFADEKSMDLLREGRYKDFFIKTSADATSSIPSFALSMLPVAGPAIMGAATMKSKYDDIKEQYGDVMTAEGATNAIITGTLDGIGAKFTAGIGKVAADLARKVGTTAAKRTMGTIVTDIGKKAGGAMLTEGGEEALVKLGENIVDKATINPDQDLGEGVFESAAAGAFLGPIPVALGGGVKIARFRGEQKEYNKQLLLNAIDVMTKSHQAFYDPKDVSTDTVNETVDAYLSDLAQSIVSRSKGKYDEKTVLQSPEYLAIANNREQIVNSISQAVGLAETFSQLSEAEQAFSSYLDTIESQGTKVRTDEDIQNALTNFYQANPDAAKEESRLLMVGRAFASQKQEQDATQKVENLQPQGGELQPVGTEEGQQVQGTGQEAQPGTDAGDLAAVGGMQAGQVTEQPPVDGAEQPTITPAEGVTAQPEPTTVAPTEPTPTPAAPTAPTAPTAAPEPTGVTPEPTPTAPTAAPEPTGVTPTEPGATPTTPTGATRRVTKVFSDETIESDDLSGKNRKVNQTSYIETEEGTDVVVTEYESSVDNKQAIIGGIEMTVEDFKIQFPLARNEVAGLSDDKVVTVRKVKRTKPGSNVSSTVEILPFEALTIQRFRNLMKIQYDQYRRRYGKNKSYFDQTIGNYWQKTMELVEDGTIKVSLESNKLQYEIPADITGELRDKAEALLRLTINTTDINPMTLVMEQDDSEYNAAFAGLESEAQPIVAPSATAPAAPAKPKSPYAITGKRRETIQSPVNSRKKIAVYDSAQTTVDELLNEFEKQDEKQWIDEKKFRQIHERVLTVSRVLSRFGIKIYFTAKMEKSTKVAKGVYFDEILADGSPYIVISAKDATVSTVVHEAFHAIIRTGKLSPNELVYSLYKPISDILKNNPDTVATYNKIQDWLKGAKYRRDEVPEEFLAQLSGYISDGIGKKPLNKSSIAKLESVINNVLEKLLGKDVLVVRFTNNADVIDFFNTLTDGLTAGDTTQVERALELYESGRVTNPRKTIYFKGTEIPNGRLFVRNTLKTLDRITDADTINGIQNLVNKTLKLIPGLDKTSVTIDTGKDARNLIVEMSDKNTIQGKKIGATAKKIQDAIADIVLAINDYLASRGNDPQLEEYKLDPIDGQDTVQSDINAEMMPEYEMALSQTPSNQALDVLNNDTKNIRIEVSKLNKRNYDKDLFQFSYIQLPNGTKNFFVDSYSFRGSSMSNGLNILLSNDLSKIEQSSGRLLGLPYIDKFINANKLLDMPLTHRFMGVYNVLKYLQDNNVKEITEDGTKLLDQKKRFVISEIINRITEGGVPFSEKNVTLKDFARIQKEVDEFKDTAIGTLLDETTDTLHKMWGVSKSDIADYDIFGIKSIITQSGSIESRIYFNVDNYLGFLLVEVYGRNKSRIEDAVLGKTETAAREAQAKQSPAKSIPSEKISASSLQTADQVRKMQQKLREDISNLRNSLNNMDRESRKIDFANRNKLKFISEKTKANIVSFAMNSVGISPLMSELFTGITSDVVGNPRIAIGARTARIKKNIGTGESGTLSSFLSFSDMYDLIPQLADYTVKHDAAVGNGQATIDLDARTISVGDMNTEQDFFIALMNEVRYAAQDFELFEAGVTPEGSLDAQEVFAAMRTQINMHVKQLQDKLDRDKKAGMNEQFIANSQAILDEAKAQATQINSIGDRTTYFNYVRSTTPSISSDALAKMDPSDRTNILADQMDFDGTTEELLFEVADTEQFASQDSMVKSRKIFDQTKFISVANAMQRLATVNPDYLRPVLNSIREMRRRTRNGELQPSDVAKAWMMSVASQQAGPVDAATANKHLASKGINVVLDESVFAESYSVKDRKTKETVIKQGGIRPEAMAAMMLSSSMGRKFLSDLNKGQVDTGFIDKFIDAISLYGMQNKKRESIIGTGEKKGIYQLREVTSRLNEIGKKGPEANEEFYKELMTLGMIKEGKAGFMGQFLGISDRGVIDSRQLDFWIENGGDGEKKISDKASAELIARIGMVAKRLGFAEEDAYIAHHLIWDKVGGIEVVHQSMYELMMDYNLQDEQNMMFEMAENSVPDTLSSSIKSNPNFRPAVRLIDTYLNDDTQMTPYSTDHELARALIMQFGFSPYEARQLIEHRAGRRYRAAHPMTVDADASYEAMIHYFKQASVWSKEGREKWKQFAYSLDLWVGNYLTGVRTLMNQLTKQAGAGTTPSELNAYAALQNMRGKSAFRIMNYRDKFIGDPESVSSKRDSFIGRLSSALGKGATEMFNKFMIAQHQEERYDRLIAKQLKKISEMMRVMAERDLEAQQKQDTINALNSIMAASSDPAAVEGQMKRLEAEIEKLSKKNESVRNILETQKEFLDQLEQRKMSAVEFREKVFDEMTPEQLAKAREFYAEFKRDYVDEFVNVLLDGGIISQERADYLLNGTTEDDPVGWQFYVPLLIEESAYADEYGEFQSPMDGAPNGKSYATIANPGIQRLRGAVAFGEQDIQNILHVVFDKLTRATVLAEQNLARQTMADMLQQYPSQTLYVDSKGNEHPRYQVISSRARPVVNEFGEVVGVDDYTPEVVKKQSIQFIDKDGKMKYMFFANANDPVLLGVRAKPSEFSAMGKGIIKGLNILNNVFRPLITQFSPTFIIQNPFRDVQEALISIDTEGKQIRPTSRKLKRSLLKNYFKAIAFFAGNTWLAKAMGVDNKTSKSAWRRQMYDMWMEVQQEGGRMSWAMLGANPTESMESLQKSMLDAELAATANPSNEQVESWMQGVQSDIAAKQAEIDAIIAASTTTTTTAATTGTTTALSAEDKAKVAKLTAQKKALELKLKAVEKTVNAAGQVVYRVKNPKFLIKDAFLQLSKLSDFTENLSRLAAHTTVREAGGSPREGAMVARNITINFEKRGLSDALRAGNAGWLFLNVGIQGARRFGKLLANPEGRKAMLTLIILSAANRALFHAFTDDEEEEYNKKKYIYSDYIGRNKTLVHNPFNPNAPIMIPKAYGLSRLAYTLGEGMVDMAYELKSPGDIAIDATMDILTAVDPIGGGSSAPVNYLPVAALSPLFQVAFNQDYMGNEIMRSYGFSSSMMPDYQKKYKTTEEWAVKFAEEMYNIPIGPDVSPITIEFLAKEYGGLGPARFLQNINDMAKLAEENGEQLGIDKVLLSTIKPLYREDISEKAAYDMYILLDVVRQSGARSAITGIPEGKKKFMKDALDHVRQKELMKPQQIVQMKKALRARYPNESEFIDGL